MDDLLAKLMAKKQQDDEMDPTYKSSKMQVLQNLKDHMTQMMGGDLSGLKKVTVAAPDSAGLAAGLSQAKDLMAKGGDAAPAMADANDDHEHEAEDDDSTMEPAEGSEMEHSDPDSTDAMSPEELQAHIADLQALLAHKTK